MVDIHEKGKEVKRMFETITEKIVLVLLGFVLLITLLFAFPIVTVPTGNLGVVTRFGAVQDRIYPEGGPYFVIPFVERVHNMNVRTLKYQTDADSASKDLQSIMSTIAINYHLNPQSVSKLYQTLGDNGMIEGIIIDPSIEESAKAATAKFTAEELITNRKETRDELTMLLTEKLKDVSSDGIVLDEVNIVNFKFSEEFDKSIEAKVTAEQKALEEKWNLEKVKYQAQQKVEQAKAEAESITIQGETLRQNPEVLQLRYIEKWDGKMPLVVGNSNPLLSLSMGNVTPT